MHIWPMAHLLAHPCICSLFYVNCSQLGYGLFLLWVCSLSLVSVLSNQFGPMATSSVELLGRGPGPTIRYSQPSLVRPKSLYPLFLFN